MRITHELTALHGDECKAEVTYFLLFSILSSYLDSLQARIKEDCQSSTTFFWRSYNVSAHSTEYQTEFAIWSKAQMCDIQGQWRWLTSQKSMAKKQLQMLVKLKSVNQKLTLMAWTCWNCIWGHLAGRVRSIWVSAFSHSKAIYYTTCQHLQNRYLRADDINLKCHYNFVR